MFPVEVAAAKFAAEVDSLQSEYSFHCCPLPDSAAWLHRKMTSWLTARRVRHTMVAAQCDRQQCHAEGICYVNVRCADLLFRVVFSPIMENNTCVGT